jgi:hypothetical protein
MEKQNEAITLRVQNRLSLKEIALRLGVAKGSASLWLRDYPLSKEELVDRRNTSGLLNKPSCCHDKTCITCGGSFTHGKLSQRHCSRKCASREGGKQSKQSWDRRRAVLLVKWKSGVIVPSERSAKGYLIIERGRKCEDCGWSKVNPKSLTVPIELEHVDGDCYNNSYSNCRLLCPNCHSLTPTYRGMNMGKGRGRKLSKVVSAWAKERNVRLNSKGGTDLAQVM